MKTIIKLSWICALFLIISSCDKEDEMIESNTLMSYNNGMTKSYSNQKVVQWSKFLSTSIDTKMPQPAEGKIYAMVNLAIHDALNNIVPVYESYALDNSMVDASEVSKNNIQAIADAAVSQAAHDMIKTLYPAAETESNALLSSSLNEIEDETSKAKGIQIGKNAVEAILQKRQNDQRLTFEAYTSTNTAPGYHQANYLPWITANPPAWPANAVYAPNLGNLTPFGINTGDQFRNVTPYTVDSQEYTDDFNEVKSLGCKTCPQRTSEQTEIGAFWIESQGSSMNRLARSLIVEDELDGWEAARLIALLGISQMDAYIASFNGKYYYNFWRPITAVRAAENDGNPDTSGDNSWTPSFTTPPTPDFPSTHAYCGGAAAEIFKNFFKTDDRTFTVSSPYTLPGVERTMTSFSQASRENAESRIYIGYHFRHAIEVGEMQGKLLGAYVFENSLKKR